MFKRIRLIIRYILNNRLKEYEKIICNAIKNDYQVISLRDYVLKNFNPNKKIFILRHDVDHRSYATKGMFEIEKKYGVKSSFYFRNSTFEPVLMKEIELHGSESSLHFEPIADFIKANPNIKTKEDLFKTDFKTKCLKILKFNLETYRLLCDIPCLTIASHGEKENIMVGLPNNFLTEDISTYEYLDIKLEAYNKELIDKTTCYISDVPIEINFGYRYGLTPNQAITNGEKFIIFLSHPNHWHYTKWQLFRKLVKVIFFGYIEDKTKFKRI